MNSIEIMAPVGSYESLTAAIQAGAGSVYFGIGKLNMRARSSVNFTHQDLKNIVGICNKHNVKSYLTVNTIIYNEELDEVFNVLDLAKSSGVSAIIASDFAVIKYAKKINLKIHISTQCNVTNIEAVKFYAQFADVIVLAREVSLKHIFKITQQIKNEKITGPSNKPIKIEVFVHGALCMAISGRCYLSLHTQDYSANRGACLQPCRRNYLLTDKEEKIELDYENGYVLSPKDLCTIRYLDKIIKAGATVLKIEGRGRSPEYVKTVVETYKQAISDILINKFNQDIAAKLENQLRNVFNRDFWDGYYLRENIKEWATTDYGNQARYKKIYMAQCMNYFSDMKVAEFKIETGEIHNNDDLIIIGPTTGVIELKADDIRVNTQTVKTAKKGDSFSIKTPVKIRRSDKLYKKVKATYFDD